MRKKRLKEIDIKFFVFPFLALLFVFLVIAVISVKTENKHTYETIRAYSVNIANNYAQRLINSKAATEIITKLFDEKLIASAKAVMLEQKKTDTAVLQQLADMLSIYEINIYDSYGKIIGSTQKDRIGWYAQEGHPFFDMTSTGKDFFVEEIRQNTQSGEFMKFAYAKGKDGELIQVGVLADNIKTLLKRYEAQQLIADIMSNEDISNVFFTDENFNLIASGVDEHEALLFDEDFICEHFLLNKAKAEIIVAHGKTFLHVCTPVYVENKKVGTLTIFWSPDILKKNKKDIASQTAVRFIFVAIILGAVMYYAYRKNKQNLKISYYDKQTNLPNESYLKDYLGQEIKSKRKNAVLLLHFTSLGLLKLTYDRDYFDYVISSIVGFIEKSIGQSDFLFKISMDRLILVINDYKDLDTLIDKATHLINSFNASGHEVGKPRYIRLKIAIYEIDNNKDTADKVLRNASLTASTLDNKKEESIAVFNEKMRDILKRKELIEKEINSIVSANGNSSFWLVFQPLLSISENKIIGFEALSRIKSAELGVVSSEEFIKIAEDRNLIFPLGKVILEKACCRQHFGRAIAAK